MVHPGEGSKDRMTRSLVPVERLDRGAYVFLAINKRQTVIPGRNSPGERGCLFYDEGKSIRDGGDGVVGEGYVAKVVEDGCVIGWGYLLDDNAVARSASAQA